MNPSRRQRVTGPTATQCGKRGATCSACATNDICKADQTCGLDPAATWRLWVSSAVIASSNHGVGWDAFGGAPDPEMALWCPSTATTYSALMPKVDNTFTPSWSGGGCTARAGQFLADGVAFDGLEIDSSSSNEVIAHFTVTPITEADLRAGTKTVGQTDGFNSVTFRFLKQ